MRKVSHKSEANKDENDYIAFVCDLQEFIKMSLDQDSQIEEEIEAPSLKTHEAYNVCYPTQMRKKSVVIGIIEIG